MRTWFGYPVRECECGFSTPDEDEFQRHLRLKGHKEAGNEKQEVTDKEKGKNRKSVSSNSGSKEDNNA